jgi:hypothetical protein
MQRRLDQDLGLIHEAPDWPPQEIAIEVADGFSVISGERRTEYDLPDEIGALTQWRAEVASGVRSKETPDALAKASAYELNSRDELRLGLRSAARQSRLAAIDTIVESVAEHAA